MKCWTFYIIFDVKVVLNFLFLKHGDGFWGGLLLLGQLQKNLKRSQIMIFYDSAYNWFKSFTCNSKHCTVLTSAYTCRMSSIFQNLYKLKSTVMYPSERLLLTLRYTHTQINTKYVTRRYNGVQYIVLWPILLTVLGL